LHEDVCTFKTISRRILLRIRNFSEKKVVKLIRTHVTYYVKFLLISCLLRDNVEKYGREREATDGNVVQRMSFACWITKATGHTLMMCNSYGIVTETMVTPKCLNFTSYEHCLSCLYFDFLLRSISG
jgi:hypothetical protein